MRSRSHDQMGLTEEEIERLLRLGRVLRLDADARANGRDTLFFGNPMFTGAGTRRVLVQLRGPLGTGGYFVASVSCDLAAGACTQGHRVRRRAWSAIVDNPSRPLAAAID